ncbi:MAG: hypothetical protein ACR2FY_11570 [Pirellulaceae bacterium]
MRHAERLSVDRLRAAIRNLFAAVVVENLTLPNENHRASVAGVAAQSLYELGEKLANEFKE